MAFELFATLTSGSSTSLDVTNIPQSYKHLYFILTSDARNQGVESYIRVNNNNNNNYKFRHMYLNGTGIAQSYSDGIFNGLLFQSGGFSGQGCRFIRGFISGYSLASGVKPINFSSGNGGNGRGDGIGWSTEETGPITSLQFEDNSDPFENVTLKVYGIK